MRMLRVLHDLFYQPMAEGGFFPLEELQNIFPSLDELIEVHCECRAVALRATAGCLLRGLGAVGLGPGTFSLSTHHEQPVSHTGPPPWTPRAHIPQGQTPSKRLRVGHGHTSPQDRTQTYLLPARPYTESSRP